MLNCEFRVQMKSFNFFGLTPSWVSIKTHKQMIRWAPSWSRCKMRNLNLAADPWFQTPVWYKIQWDLSLGKQHCVQSFGKGDISFIKKSHATGLSQLWIYWFFFLSLHKQNLYFSSTRMRCEYDVMHTDRHAFPDWYTAEITFYVWFYLFIFLIIASSSTAITVFWLKCRHTKVRGN